MLSYTKQKAEVLDFGYPLMYFSYAVAIKSPEFEPLKFVLFKPFGDFVWLGFFTTFVLTMICMALISFAAAWILPKSLKIF